MKRKKSVNSRKSTDKKKSALKLLLKATFLVFLFCLSFGVYYYYNMFSQLKQVDIAKDNESLGISQETLDKLEANNLDGKVINIALFGIDARNPGETSRSDSIMVGTLDFKNNKFKITSFMRDTYVAIPGHGNDKLTHAYAFGGAALAIKTLNQNFGLNIKDYMTINFYGMEDVIDAVGGVEVEVEKNEVAEINKYIKELCDIDKKKYIPIKNAGMQTLNGRQAVNFARIRKVGNGDYERTERQREVLDQVFKKILSAGKSEYPNIISKLLPMMETSMSQTDILSTGASFFSSGITEMEATRFPLDGYCKDQTIKGVYYLVPTQPSTKNQLYEYIFNNVSIQEQLSNTSKSTNSTNSTSSTSKSTTN